MKYITTESQLDRASLKFLNTKYGDLVPYEISEFPNFIFFMKDGEVIFNYHKKNGKVYISDDKIWSFLESFFGLINQEIRELTKEWAVQHYNLDVTTTSSIKNWTSIKMAQHYNLDVTRILRSAS